MKEAGGKAGPGEDFVKTLFLFYCLGFLLVLKSHTKSQFRKRLTICISLGFSRITELKRSISLPLPLSLPLLPLPHLSLLFIIGFIGMTYRMQSS